ncbi:MULTISPECIES: hypothetical protein [unclassified Curtobacterium]|uniref:hypothetical protein n=1 Tax=unclassified Curtobacterium TaxID=257496 RepID=UPI0014045930|nr:MULTISPECIES: hypothetical protein [unclassified Curtobacterium]
MSTSDMVSSFPSRGSFSSGNQRLLDTIPSQTADTMVLCTANSVLLRRNVDGSTQP